MKRVAISLLILCSCAAPAIAQAPPGTIDLRVDDQPLIILLERIARQCGRGLLVHRGAAELLEREARIYAKDARWDEAVRLLREEYGVVLEYTEKRIEVRSADAIFRARLERRQYPSAAITRGLGDFPAGRLGIVWDESGAFSFGGSNVVLDLADSEAARVEDLPELIIKHLGSGAADLERGIEVSDADGVLQVRHLPEAHARVTDFLRGLERTAARQVTCRLYELRRAPAKSEVSKEELAALIQGVQPLAVFNSCDGQRGHLHSGVRHPHVAFTEAVNEVVDPVVLSVVDGLVIEVEPHVTTGGILANVQLQRCRVLGTSDARVTDAEGNAIVQAQLPRWHIEEVHDSRRVPAGGGAVLRAGSSVFLLAMHAK
ncbi:MAG: hypothetical protein L0Z55_11360 [Planctomycetes bacterium]|nr:hypothetical protein [Planctomycetota bacterium]